jgi:integrase
MTDSLAKNCISDALEVALKGTTITVFTVHDLRRTATTLLHENGCQSDVLEKALNHTIGGVRNIYNGEECADQRGQLLRLWSDFLDGCVSNRQALLGRFRPAA